MIETTLPDAAPADVVIRTVLVRVRCWYCQGALKKAFLVRSLSQDPHEIYVTCPSCDGKGDVAGHVQLRELAAQLGMPVLETELLELRTTLDYVMKELSDVRRELAALHAAAPAAISSPP